MLNQCQNNYFHLSIIKYVDSNLYKNYPYKYKVIVVKSQNILVQLTCTSKKMY